MVEQNGGANPGEGSAEPGSDTESGENKDNKPSFMTNEQFDAAIKRREAVMDRKWEKRLAEERSKSSSNPKQPAAEDEKELSRTAQMEKQIRELTKNLESRDARDKDNNLRNLAKDNLLKSGIAAEFVDHAMAYLIDAKKFVRYAEDGVAVIQVGNEEYEDLAAGIEVWAASKEAKLYKLPSGTTGSGDGRRITRKTVSESSNDKLNIERKKDGSLTKTSKVDLNDMLKSALLRK